MKEFSSWQGLTDAQVLENRKLYGENKLPEEKLKSSLDFIIETFKNKLNLLLLCMTIVFAILALIGHASIVEPIGIGIVIIAITLIDVHTGLKSQKNTKILKDKSSVRYCNVLRNGGIEKINTNEVVVNDIVILQSGEALPADGFLISGNIKVNNALLNGESKDCKKEVVENFIYNEDKKITADDYVDKNSLFAGAIVTEGEGHMVVKKVGVNTQNGKIILSMQEIEPSKTSLEIQLEKLASDISVFGYIGALIISIVLISSQIISQGATAYFSNDTLTIIKNIMGVLITAITIVVAAVPEGLPLIINLITAQNAKNMLKNNVLAKNTNKIPEAGNIELLCTDKTGTLTKGILTPIDNIALNGISITKDDNNIVSKLFFENILVNTSAMYDLKGQIIGGNSTDRALLSMISAKEYEKLQNVHIERKLAFSSENKYSATQILKDGKVFTYYKGAPEKFIEYAKYYESNDGKKPIEKEFVLNKIKEYTERCIRVVATGYSNKEISDDLPNDLVLTSLVAIRDDIRPECKAAVKRMHEAGVQVMMITGDVLDTAEAIANEVGIIKSQDDIAISANKLDLLTDEEVKKDLRKIKVIARATPQTKLRIVKLAKELNICVGMTGDGTNDAPALKAADVGFSMGSGTDLCKEAGDIIITDDNFVSITQSVLLGRTFIHNVKKFLKFQLPINVSMVLICVIYPLFFNIEAVVAVQILIINIVMDALVSLSFGGEPCKDEYMKEMPIKKGSRLINKEMLNELILYICFYLLAFIITMIPSVQDKFFTSEEKYLTARFVLLILIANINGFNIRTNRINLFEGILLNKMFIKIFILVFIGLILIVTFAGKFLHVTPLSLSEWIFIIGLSSLIIPVDMIRKVLNKHT